MVKSCLKNNGESDDDNYGENVPEEGNLDDLGIGKMVNMVYNRNNFYARPGRA